MFTRHETEVYFTRFSDTKASLNDTKTTDVLGISSVIIHDLKQRRQKDYVFDWNKVLQVKGDTGVRLQYTHARLCNLEEATQVRPAPICNPEYLQEPEIMFLTIQLARFNDVLIRSHQEMEACLLVRYLFHLRYERRTSFQRCNNRFVFLSNHISKAFKTLKVKGQPPELAAQRMLLFTVSKDILRQGMEILGLQPLKKM